MSYNSCSRSLCEVWPGVIEHANLVEPSEAMSFARRSLFQGDLFILLFIIVLTIQEIQIHENLLLALLEFATLVQDV